MIILREVSYRARRPGQAGVFRCHLVVKAGEQVHFHHLRHGDQAGAQAVIDVVIVVGDFVGQIGQLGFEAGLGAIQKPLAEFSQLARIGRRAVLQDAFAGFEHQVQTVEIAVVLFQRIDHPQTLQIVFEAAVIAHALVEHVLADVAEGRVTQVVGQRHRFDQVFVDVQAARQGAADLRHFDRVGQEGAKQIPLVVEEDLGLVFEAAKRGRVDDAVAVALKLAARAGRRLGEGPAAALRGMGGVRR